MARRASFLEDNLTMIAMAALAVGFVLYTRKAKTGPLVQGIAGRPRFGDGYERYTSRFDRAALAVGDKVKFQRLENGRLHQHTGTISQVNPPGLTVTTRLRGNAPGPTYEIHHDEAHSKRISGEPIDFVGASRPPPRPRDRARDAVFLEWLRAQQSKQNPER